MKSYPMLSFRCDNQFRKALEREAKRRHMSISELIKEAVAKHLHPTELAAPGQPD
jgi:predicted DNA-binding ribbon-helix-helix protein